MNAARISTTLVLGLAVGGLCHGADPASAAKVLSTDRLADLHQLIKPAAGESRWEQVPWMPGSDLWAARRKAAAEGKPVFLWYMAGEPLGTC